MTNVTETATVPDQPTPGLLSRMIGVLVSPKDTFAAIAAKPKWVGVLAITLAIGSGCQYLILSSPPMQEAMIDQALRNPNANEQQVERIISILPYALAGGTLILGAGLTAITAGILMLIFSTLMGGSATFKQVYAAVAHSGVVSSLQGIVTAGLLLLGAKPSGTNPPGANLAIFVPMLEETSFVTKFLGSIDLILVWWIVTISIGLGVMYRRRTGGIATTLLAIYVVIALIVGYVRSGS
jgi:Yip1 domain